MRGSTKWLLGLGSLAAATSLMSRERVEAEPRIRRLPRHYDPLFRRFGRGIPVAYLRALVKMESNFNPSRRSGPGWGLMQITEVVRRDFNQRQGTRIRRADLLNPRINIEIGTETLQRIVASYGRNHADVPNMRTDWSNLRFVELVTFGWNAGYSERAGVGRVVRFLDSRGQKGSVTIDSVHRWATAAGVTRHLTNPKKVAWSKRVATLYAIEAASR